HGRGPLAHRRRQLRAGVGDREPAGRGRVARPGRPGRQPTGDDHGDRRPQQRSVPRGNLIVDNERNGHDEDVRDLSVFFPAHNEAESLARTVTSAVTALERLGLQDLEIILVDDGSTDGTAAIAQRLAAKDSRIRLVHHPMNRGYGAALRSGFAAARRDWIFYTDSDGQFDLSDIDRLLPYARDFDAVVGYRIRRSDHPMRRVNQALWSGLVRRMLGVDVRDVDC